MSTTAEKARLLWRRWGVYDSKATRCDGCGSITQCKRSSARSRWLCIDCFDLSPEADR